VRNKRLNERLTSEKELMKERLVEADAIKTVCYILLFVVHTSLISQLLGQIPFSNNLNQLLATYLNSAMFFLAGYFLWQSFSKRSLSLKSFLKQKAIALYIPYLFFIWVTYFLYKDTDWFANVKWSLGLNIFWRTVNGPLPAHFFSWFIGSLLAYVLLFSLLEKFVKRERRIALIILAFLVLTLAVWSISDWNGAYGLGNPNSIPVYVPDFTFITYLPIFYGGLLVCKYNVMEKIHSNLKLKIALVMLSAISSYLILINWAIPIGAITFYFLGSYGIPAVFGLVTAISSLFIFRYFRKILNANVLSYITSNGLILYLLQPLCIVFVASILNDHFSFGGVGGNFNIWETIVWVFISFWLAVLLSHVFSNYYARIRSIINNFVKRDN
jgi:hypothetical protein